MPLTQGQILNNRYRIVKLLGQGGFGAVYKAWDLNFEVVCAIKENFETSVEAQRQFLREARLLHVLRHPNLPLVKDHFVIPGQGQYLVMDYVEGQDLEELRCAAGGKLPEAQALGWISQVCEALDYLHRQTPPVIHRDLKPANIKITPEGRAMLVDFGIAKTYDPLLKTTLGARAVTPGYSPFEQYGTGITDARTDLYSLGATLYTLLTGQEPPEAPQRAVRDPLVPPRGLNPAISPEIETALLRALHVDAEQRFQSAAEFEAAISKQLSVAGRQPAVVTQPPATLPVAQGSARGSAAAAASPLPARRGKAGGGVSPATLGIPLPQPVRRFSWKWVGIGAGLLVGLALLAVVVGLVAQGISGSRLTQTSQARGSRTAEALAAVLSQTPSPLAPTLTSNPSPLPPSLTPSPPPLLPVTPLPGSTQISPVDGMVMSYIPGGTFQMGSESGDSDEQPVHAVTLDGFWMDQTEVTNAMYAQCVATGACSLPHRLDSENRSSYYGDPAYDNYPVILVDWNQATIYCSWTGRRLPTEAEWEYAARGGLAGATYPWGEGIDCTQANYFDGSTYCAGDTSETGRYTANGYGLYDLAGNVWEWVADWYGPYSGQAVENPTGPISGDNRVQRGGSWGDVDSRLRVSSRHWNTPDNWDDHFGFRCASTTAGDAAAAPTRAPLTPVPTAAPVLSIGSTQISPVDGMVLRYIPAGTFLMGSESGESDEQPVHSVTLDAFWMDQTEVTNAMYAQCVADGACSSPHDTGSYTRSSYYDEAAYADYPVIYVDWYQAQAYCTWAGRELPSEAQWEYAARGGLDGATYPWGNEAPSCTLGAQNGAQHDDCSPHDTIAVGSFAPNGYGLYDMAGNVWEWVEDWYGPYSSWSVYNPVMLSDTYHYGFRILRGGMWQVNDGWITTSRRWVNNPSGSFHNIGFRCAFSP